jgi:deoxycytidylate deaminase
MIITVDSLSRYFHQGRRLIKEQIKHCSMNEINDMNGINDMQAFNLLHSIESTSPANNPNQRVGCILFGGKDCQIKTITSTNTYPKNTGVHAELNAISTYLKSLPNNSSETILNMLVTYSPCLECAKIIEYIPEIKHIKYSFAHDDNAIKMLEKSINIGKLDIPYKKRNLKLHSYSSVWLPEVKNIYIYI